VLGDQSAGESPFLAFLVGLHVATALALLVFFRAEWARIIAGLLRSVRQRRIETADERLGWMLVAATIPAGLFGLAFEHALRVLFARPLAAAAFLTVNGLLLLAGEGLRRSAGRQRLEARLDPERLRGRTPADVASVAQPSGGAPRLGEGDFEPEARLAALSLTDALLIGAAQILAFFAGISRSGATRSSPLMRW
jgi:undecaprenyl-diphosphatase